MKFNELPQEVQDKLNKERKSLCTKKRICHSREIKLYNPEGTRRFWAKRVPKYIKGYSYWDVSYCPMGIAKYDGEYIIKSIPKEFSESENGTKIHNCFSREEVIKMAMAIGTLVM